MLKRKIKIILIGLFSLLFMGLVYSLFSTKPEIISDESLRIEEPAIPGLESQVERAENIRMNRPSIIDSDEPAASFHERALGDGVEKSNFASLAQAPTKVVEADPTPTLIVINEAELPKSAADEQLDKEASTLKGQLMQPANPFSNEMQVEDENTNRVASEQDGFLTFEKIADSEASGSIEGHKTEQLSGIAVPGDTSGFLDLNLAEVKSKPLKLRRVDGEQLILDDINNGLTQYQSTTGSKGLDRVVADEKKIVPKPFTTKPSVFNMPEMDESLMQGDSKISQQYRQTMSKLISLNAKLQTADEENTELRAQFEIAVSQNRQLAQIIRDIDNQIKAYTLTN